MMDQEAKEVLKSFFDAQAKLAELKIIRSYRYAHDISVYLAQQVYGFTPRKSRQPANYDGQIGSSRVLVRFNNCPHGQKVILHEPLGFDELVVVLGPTCALRPTNIANAFCLYRYNRAEVLELFQTPGGAYVGGKELFGQGPDVIVSLD